MGTVQHEYDGNQRLTPLVTCDGRVSSGFPGSGRSLAAVICALIADMPKRQGTPRWSQGLEPAIPSGPSEFDRVVTRLKLSPDQYTDSPQLRAWVKENWRQKFVPEKLLKVWGLSEWPLLD